MAIKHINCVLELCTMTHTSIESLIIALIPLIRSSMGVCIAGKHVNTGLYIRKSLLCHELTITKVGNSAGVNATFTDQIRNIGEVYSSSSLPHGTHLLYLSAKMFSRKKLNKEKIALKIEKVFNADEKDYRNQQGFNARHIYVVGPRG